MRKRPGQHRRGLLVERDDAGAGLAEPRHPAVEHLAADAAGRDQPSPGQ